MCLPVVQGKNEKIIFLRETLWRRLEVGRRANDGVLVEDGVHDGRSFVRRVDDVDFAIAGLDGVGIGEGIVAARNVATIGIGFVAVR